MEEIIRKMMQSAEQHHDCELASFAEQLMGEMCRCWNCPSDWRDIAEHMAEEFQGNDWLEEECQLWNYR